MWQQLALTSELESDIRDTVDWSKKWLVDLNARKTQLVSFDQSLNSGAIDTKLDGSILDEKPSFKMPGLPFSSKLDWGSYIVSIAKTAPLKIEALWIFFLLRLRSVNLPYGLVWNTFVMSVRVVATWIC